MDLYRHLVMLFSLDLKSEQFAILAGLLDNALCYKHQVRIAKEVSA